MALAGGALMGLAKMREVYMPKADQRATLEYVTPDELKLALALVYQDMNNMYEELDARLLMLEGDTGNGGDEMPIKESGPITVTGDGKTIEGYTTIHGGITATNVRGLTIRKNSMALVIDGQRAVNLNGCSQVRIEDLAFGIANAPARRLPREQKGIYMGNCQDIIINRVRGIATGCMFNPVGCQRITITQVEGRDSRCHAMNTNGDPRGYSGQFCQINNSEDVVLDGFSIDNDLDVAATVDNVSVYASRRIKILNGRIVGNTDPTGVGVMIEDGSTEVEVRNVDLAKMSNGATSVYDGSRADFYGIRSRDLYSPCKESQIAKDASGKYVFTGNHNPSSGGGHFFAHPSAAYVAYRNQCRWWTTLANNQVAWDQAKMSAKEWSQENFSMRPPVGLVGFPFS